MLKNIFACKMYFHSALKQIVDCCDKVGGDFLRGIICETFEPK